MLSISNIENSMFFLSCQYYDSIIYWYSTQAIDEKGCFGLNIAAFCSKKADEFMDLNRKQLNTAGCKATLQEFGVLLNKELPWVSLYAADIAKVYRSGVTGWLYAQHVRRFLQCSKLGSGEIIHNLVMFNG